LSDVPYSFYFRNSVKVTQSPGARSYFQNLQPLHDFLLHATAPAADGDLWIFPPKRISPFLITLALISFPLSFMKSVGSKRTY
jgi:hypothetical protein